MRRRLLHRLSSHGIGLTPILVYQMAKVGSSSVVEALRERGLPVFHVHRLNREHLDRMRESRRALGWQIGPIPAHDLLGFRLQRDVIARGRAAKVITLVRDPIARNLSSYFEHVDAIFPTMPSATDELCRGFTERFPHREALTWFDDELQAVTGIDVYATPFPRDGHLTIRKGRTELLILKSELDDAAKASAIAAFLGLESLTLRPANVTESKAKGAAYRAFRERLQLSESYVDELLNARYTRHFYSDEERAAMRAKWLRTAQQESARPAGHDPGSTA